MSRALLLGGVATACVLGAGVGLWARPHDMERPGAPKAQPTSAPVASADRRLAIVVDDTPAPVGKPLDVLTHPPARPAIAPAGAHAAAPPPPAAAEPVAPSRPPNGLVRVVAHVPAALAAAVAPPHKAEPHPAPVAAPPAAPTVLKPAAAELVTAKPRELAPKPVKRIVAAAPAAPPAHPAARLAKLERPKTAKLAARAKHEPHRRHETELAEVKPAAPKPRHGLGVLAHALAKLAPRHAKPEAMAHAEAPPAKRRKAAEIRLAKAAPRRARPPAVVAAATAPKVALPIRVANVQSRCASSDPGEALACGDPGLSAADRRLQRAYHDAEAAGVPASTLERQQQRWRAARAAAAREAPWAVRQVYQARIAELQDLARDARGN